MMRAIVAALLCAPLVAQAQWSPSKAIRVIVPFTPGSSLDVVARTVAPRVSEFVGQPVVVENRGGAGGTLGSEYVAKAAADGYTLVLASTSTHIAPLFLSKSLPYDPVKDFTPITNAAEPVATLLVNPALPIYSVKDLIDYAKKNPGKLAYASNGIGTGFHFAGEALKSIAGIDMLHVPMQGAGDALNAIVGGHVQVGFIAFANIGGQLAAGKVRVLAIANADRFAALPGVPPLAESVPGFERAPGWFGYMGPGGLPRPVLTRLNVETVRALRDMQPKLESLGLMVIADTPEHFAAEIRRGTEVFARLVKAAGLKPE